MNASSIRLSSIVKPSNLADFLRLQTSCLSDDMPGLRFLARFEHYQPHVASRPTVELLALYEVVQSSVLEISFLVTDHSDEALALFEQSLTGKEMAAQLHCAWVELQRGLSLQSVEIPKPWGKEIWYTGIEQRGVSCVHTEEGNSPLDWIIAAGAGQILAEHRTPILLKILDPLPDEDFGDLYFEMHEAKQEVYVVTHIDKQAWPDGKGGIRFGFDQHVRTCYASDKEFRQAYLNAVNDYRNIREHIDSLLDEKRSAENIGLNDTVPPEVIRRWMSTLEPALMQQEKQSRTAMESFIALKSLSVGDVIRVPCFTPHSLLHGVRTIEFQTPVYERKILSFAQKVLTQTHWDTQDVLEKLVLDDVAQDTLEIIYRDTKVCRERIVQFSDFRVERITLERGAKLNLERVGYQLLLVIEGEVVLNGRACVAADAVLVPAMGEFWIESRHKTVLVLAEPLPL